MNNPLLNGSVYLGKDVGAERRAVRLVIDEIIVGMRQWTVYGIVTEETQS